MRLLVADGTKVIASVKANAYGHGIVAVGRELVDAGTDVLATASFADAVALREAGIRAPILLFGGVLPEAAPHVLDHELTPTIHNLRGARAFADAAVRPCGVYVKVDSGLGRLGVPLDSALEFIETVNSLGRLQVEGVYTHLPFADRDGLEWAQRGLARFDSLLRSLTEAGVTFAVTQARSSPGILVGLEDTCNAVCPGHLLYGVPHPAADLVQEWPFEPVLRRISTHLIHITEHDGAAAGPGSAYRLSSSSRTGVVPLGRFHGNRAAREGTAAMLIRGRRVPVVGISLEHATLDLGEAGDVDVGEPVVMLGSNGPETISLSDLASWQGASVLDVLMTLDRRGRYVYTRSPDRET
jgi:alanine racemase